MEKFEIELKNGNAVALDMSIFEIDKDKGLVHLTKIAKACGREAKEWIKLESTKAYLNACKSRREESSLVDFLTVTNGIDVGTWGSRRVAIKFAQWISPDFEVWCTDILDELFQKGTVSLNNFNVPQTKLEALLLAVEQEKIIMQQAVELEHKTQVISGFVADLTIHKKRDLILKVITTTQNQFEIPQRWNMLYDEYKFVHHVDLKRLKENFNKKQKATKDKMPSILKYAEIVAGDDCINRLFELSAKLFDTDQLDVLKGLYHATKREAQKKVEYAKS